VYGQPQAPQASGAADMSVASDMGGSAAGMLSLPGAVAEEEEETFYFDEATGAVYDAQGRLVEMPAGFDASQIAGTSASHHREEVGDESVAVGMVEPASPQLSGSTALDASQQGPYESMRGAGGSAARLDEMHSSIAMPSAGTGASPLLPSEGMRRTAYMQEPRMSMDRKSSNASSLRGEVPLNHARSTHALPAMGVLDEVDYLPTSRDGLSSRHGARSIGTTAKGASMVDNNIPVSSPRRASQPSQDGARGNTANSLRQRGNRMSIGADFGRSPDSERKFNLVDEYGFPYDDDPDKLAYGRPSSQLGRGEGLAHPVMDGVEVGAMGMRMVELEMEMEEDSPYPEVRLPRKHACCLCSPLLLRSARPCQISTTRTCLPSRSACSSSPFCSTRAPRRRTSSSTCASRRRRCRRLSSSWSRIRSASCWRASCRSASSTCRASSAAARGA
jgi:hypothetical protein